jgi:hypothetical protein
VDTTRRAGSLFPIVMNRYRNLPMSNQRTPRIFHGVPTA